jgi:hypothetical protein
MQKTAKRAQVLVSKQIRKYLNLPKSLVDGNLSHYYNAQKDQAVVAIKNTRYELSAFNHKQAYGKGTYKSTGGRRTAGFKVRIWKGKPATHFKRVFRFGASLAERKGKPRFPIRILKGPSLAGVFLWAREGIQGEVDEAFLKEFDRAVKRKARGH